MSPDLVVQVVRAADALLSMLANVGITAAKIQSMRDQNADGHLTEAQCQQLARDAREAIARL